MYPSLAGLIRDFELPQVISLLEFGRMTGTLRIVGPNGKGQMAFDKGRLVAASEGATRGELAALVLVSWTEGSFSFTREGWNGERQEFRSSQSLLLEAARLLDESLSGTVVFSPGPEAFQDKAVNGARRVLRALEGPTPVGKLAVRLGIAPIEAYYYLEMLEGIGAVVRADPAGVVAGQGDGRPIRILVVDDSPLLQKALVRLYETDPGLRVVGTAANGQEALDLLPGLRPDVISLDLYMPVMDGVTTLKHIMLKQPTPTVVVTSANPDSLDLTFESILRFGAIDFITKPARARGDLEMQTRSILRRIRKAARVNLRGLRMVQPPSIAPGVRAGRGECRGLLTAVAGVGGGLAFMQLLAGLPPDLPWAVVGLLPFPDDFLNAFISFMRRAAPFDVEPVADGTLVQAGVCYLASGDRETRIVEGPWGPVLSPGLPSTGVTASPLMMDAARIFGSRSAGIVLSGEGEEALAGLGTIQAAGGVTLAQMPASCVDPEQPELAIQAGLVDRVVLPARLAASLSELLLSRSRQSAVVRSVEEVEAPWPERSA